MALSPVDFYAYSRATGTPYPEDPEERARIAPDVVNFRRNQLRAPQQEEQQGPSLTDILGYGAALAGVAAGGFGLRRALRKDPAGTIKIKEPSAAVRPATQDLSAFSAVQKSPEVERAAAVGVAPSKVAPSVETQAPVETYPDPWTSTSPTAETVVKKPFGPRTYAESTGSLPPTEDLTSVQQQELPEVIHQKISAVESGEDQSTGRQLTALQRDTDTTAGRTTVEDQINTQEIAAQNFVANAIKKQNQPDLNKTYTYADLVEKGLPDFEINARVQAYATTGNKDLMNPDINSKTVGHNEFLNAIGVKNASVDHKGRLIDGELVNPKGEVTISPFAKQQTAIAEEALEEESFDPVARQVTGLEGGVSTAPASYRKDIKLSEQYEQAVQNFRNTWDSHVNENAQLAAAGENPVSDILVPARAERLVDADDLDLPVRIETDAEGTVTKRHLYRDTLDPETIERIESGEKVVLPVPYLVNKQRAYADYKRNPSLENRDIAKAYQRTGRALVSKYNEIVGPYEGSKYIPNISEGRFYEPGESFITPEKGRNSQKGRLVGGITEELTSERLSPLRYQQVVEGGQVKQRVVEFGSSRPVNTLNELNELGDLKDAYGSPLQVSATQQRQSVMTQPMKVQKISPVLETTPEGNQQQRTVQRWSERGGKYFTAPLVTVEDVYVKAPLQMLDAQTGQEISSTGQISRNQLNTVLDTLEGRLRSQGDPADYNTLAFQLNEHLINTQGVSLPVLSSDTAFDFIEELRGKPASRPTRVSYATTSQLGDVYHVSGKDIDNFLAVNKLPALGARKAGQSGFMSTTRPRRQVGPPTLNIQEAPKERLNVIDEELLQETQDVLGSALDANDFSFSGGRSVELGSSRLPGLLQRKLAPAQTGTGAEMQQTQQALGRIEGKDWRLQFPNLYPDLGAVGAEPIGSTSAAQVESKMQQLMAQAGRRAGKRRNR